MTRKEPNRLQPHHRETIEVRTMEQPRDLLTYAFDHMVSILLNEWKRGRRVDEKGKPFAAGQGRMLKCHLGRFRDTTTKRDGARAEPMPPFLPK